MHTHLLHLTSFQDTFEAYGMLSVRRLISGPTG